MGHGISKSATVRSPGCERETDSRWVTACERRWVTGSLDRRRCDLQGVRERPARGGSRLARGGGSRLEIFSSATVRSPGCERETGSRWVMVARGGGSRLRSSARRRCDLQIGCESESEIGSRWGGLCEERPAWGGSGWLGVAGRAEREESERA